MDITKAQNDMRLSHLGGGGGVFFSGVVWLVAGILALYLPKETSILVFFFGGMLIYPMGLIISKLFNRTGKHQPNNPLATLAMESTIILFIGLFIAYAVFQIRPDWFFPIMLTMIGGRYLVFQSLYGMKLYWVLGGILILSGAACLISNQAFQIAAIVGGAIELVFALLIIKLERATQD